MPHSSSATSQIGQLQLCNEDTPFAVMCVSWLLSMTPQAASTCFRWLTSVHVAATRDLSQRRYSGNCNSSSFVDSTSLLPVASLIAVTTRTRQRTTRPHCKVEVWNFFNFLGHVELFWLYLEERLKSSLPDIGALFVSFWYKVRARSGTRARSRTAL